MKNGIIFGLILVTGIVGITVYNLWPEKRLLAEVSIDRLAVIKSKRQLLAYSNGKVLKTYRISLGGNTIGHKVYEGDKRTPEGLYTINDKNPNSGYHKNLGISYPNHTDIAKAKVLGKSPGGDVKIHGLRNQTGLIGKVHRWFDWTLGCIAVTNTEIDELYDHVKIGTPIEIKP